MLHTFLANNRDELIVRCRSKVALRPARGASALQLENGVPLFLEQLIETLKSSKLNARQKASLCQARQEVIPAVRRLGRRRPVMDTNY